MKSIDTNILVRFLVRDDAKQARAVYDFFIKAEREREELFVPLVVVLELIWVLTSVYEISRDKILDVLRDLLLLSVLKFEQPGTVHKLLQAARSSQCDLADILIAQAASAGGCQSVWTLDKRAAKSGLFEFLK